MPNVDIEKAVETAITLVRQAFDKHKLPELTKAKVRHEIEKKLELDEGVLDEKPYKKRINEAVEKTVEQVKDTKVVNSDEGHSEKDSPKVAKKLFPYGKKHVSLSNDSLSKEKKGKDSSNNKRSSKKTSGNISPKKTKPRKDEDFFKSKDVIESDGEEDHVSKKLPSPSSKKDGKRPAISDSEEEAESSTSPKRRRKSLDDVPEPKTKASPGTAKSAVKSSEAKTKENLDEDESDSELSVVIDEPPAKEKKEPKKPQKPRDSEKKSRSKKEAKKVSTNEEQTKKLKSLIVACGVRKVWSKELKDCETSSSQIAHLRKMLTDLGMKGRFSLEQAKAIKAKRDLEREMADVQEFAMKFAGDRQKRAAQKSVEEDEPSDADKDEEEDARPTRRPKTAHQSIMAFLGDQSDSE